MPAVLGPLRRDLVEQSAARVQDGQQGGRVRQRLAQHLQAGGGGGVEQQDTAWTVLRQEDAQALWDPCDVYELDDLAALVAHVRSLPPQPGGEGTVQLSFDEAPPAATPPALREAIPEVSYLSPGSGRATLRVRMQVVPRVQKAEQSIVLSVGRTSARRNGGR